MAWLPLGYISRVYPVQPLPLGISLSHLPGLDLPLLQPSVCPLVATARACSTAIPSPPGDCRSLLCPLPSAPLWGCLSVFLSIPSLTACLDFSDEGHHGKLGRGESVSKKAKKRGKGALG